MGVALTIERDGFGALRPDTDPSSIEPAIATAPRPGRPRQRLRLQFDEVLPDAVLAAAAQALRAHPDVGLRAYGRAYGPGGDPSLAWTSGFEHIKHLSVDIWHARSFDRLRDFKNLITLGLGRTASKRPSLAFLAELPALEDLWIEAHDKDFAAVGEVATLSRLRLRVPRVKSLESLRGHPALEVFDMDFGGIRDLTPLADLPCLRGLHLYQVRKLDTGDLAVLGDCTSLEALSLGALRNVNDLSMLARGPSETLRFLILERLTQLDTLAPVASCKRLEQLGLYESKPTDARLDVLLGAPRLSHLIVGDAYPREQFDALRARGGWKALWHRGNPVQDGKPAVRWRAPVASLLESPSLR